MDLTIHICVELKETYDTFKSGMLEHMQKEDDVDFPKLIKYEQGEVVNDINTVIDDLVSDHIATGQLLVKMSDLTSSYEPPIRGMWYVATRLSEIKST